MAIQYSTTVRNAQLDQVEVQTGTDARLIIRTGAQPADCGTADSGSVLATITCPTDWMAAASGGTKAKSGTWSVAASGTGTAGHFRIKDSTQTTCHMQGSVGQGSGDLSLDNTSIASGQTVTISTFTITAGNA